MNMKKTLIAAGVAAAMAVPMAATADVSLTAQIQAEVINLSGDGRANGNGMYIGDAMSGGAINAGNYSRLDFRTSHDLGNGLTALGHIAVNMNVNAGVFNNAARELTAGLRGDFGTVRVGRLIGAYFTSNKDPFHATFLQARGNGGMLGGFGGLGNGAYLNSAIDYRGDFGPVALAGTMALDETPGSGSSTNGDHAYALRANFNIDPVEVWVAYTNADEYGELALTATNDFEAIKVGVEWKSGPIGLMAQYENITHEDAVTGADTANAGDYYMVAGTYSMGANTLMAGYGEFSGELDTDQRWISLGARHAFTRQVSVHAGVRQTQYNDTDDKETAVGAGMRVVF
jgi:predicted porin